jgi:hypothetical protein
MGRIVGASERDRTSDLLITNQLLYRLSYAGLEGSSKLNETGFQVKSDGSGAGGGAGLKRAGITREQVWDAGRGARQAKRGKKSGDTYQM